MILFYFFKRPSGNWKDYTEIIFRHNIYKKNLNNYFVVCIKVAL